MLHQSISSLRADIKSKKIDPVDLIKEAYGNIVKNQPSVNALITVRDEKDALADLKSADSNSPLYGIPYVMKDGYVTKGIRTTAASKILDTFIPPYSATVYEKLKKAGAILIGKANMDAWGHGASTENTDYGVTKNPWDLSRVAGGSSGGSAAAIASDMSQFAIGEDTGGSIRNPAGWTNVTGLKVTYGRVSRYGAIAYASSFDTVGPMARSVADVAELLSVMAGLDPYDGTSSPEPVPNYVELLNQDLKGLKIGLPIEMFSKGLNPEIHEVIKTAAAEFTKLGYEVIDVSLPIAEIGLATYYLIAPSETSSNLARYDGVRYGGKRDLFTQEAMRRIMIGTFALSSGYSDAYYRKAQKVRTILMEAYAKAFTQCDVLLMPVSPTVATKIGDLSSDPLASMMADLYTTTINQVGIPSLVLPAGFSKEGMPIGMQLVAPMFKEDKLLALGHEYQGVTDWHTRSPKL
ncbi:Asp-tRNA(Asn)/Glu-tRNA(Gln) amidotransferase subunit GatA [Candidatus Woesebacteria bacterium]|nr:Asp-tRNA(Asn)/Glu-tRNA(Gln) amidotransferase subunit GatA [Candidatus Woesebacteria bacterium]